MAEKPAYEELERRIQELAKTEHKYKRLEKALTANYTLLRIAGETTRFGGWRFDLFKNTVTRSDTVADIHEMPRGYSSPMKDIINFYGPEWQEKITQIFTGCAENDIP